MIGVRCNVHACCSQTESVLAVSMWSAQVLVQEQDEGTRFISDSMRGSMLV